jgi:hypothetical protein
MDMSVLSSLSPEERAELMSALEAANKPDPVCELTKVVDALKSDLSAAREEIGNLKALVMDDLIGGIKAAYDGNVRTERMGEFKSKFGSMLDPLAEPFKRTFSADLHEKAFDYADELRGEEGFSEDNLGAKLQEVVDQIKERLGMKEEPAAEVVAEVAPEAEKPAEAPAGEAEEEPEEDAQMAWDEIAAMKKKDDAKSAQRDKNKPVRKGA